MERLYLKPTLCKAIEEYCKLNDIEDINAFANRCATQGFNIVKFGLSPKYNIEREKNGIKDIKNERTRKKKESDGKDKGKQEKTIRETSKPAEKEEVKPAEKGKDVTVRKIVVIKKNKKDD